MVLPNREDLLKDIEFEYKYSLHPKYVEAFIELFCKQFNCLVDETISHSDNEQIKALQGKAEQFYINPEQGKVETLSNVYFDTPENLLYKTYRAGLRLRTINDSVEQEQTIKLQKENTGASHSNLEFTVLTAHKQDLPDFSLFSEHQLPEGFDRDFFQEHIIAKYRTDFKRRRFDLKFPGFAQIDMAIDLGEIKADNGLSAPICEVEFELLNLDPIYLEEAYGKTVCDIYDIRFDLSIKLNHLLMEINKAHTIKHNHEVEEKLVKRYGEKARGSFVHRFHGLVGLEPFSKLMRAVMLSSLPPNPQASDYPRVDTEKLKGEVIAYLQKESPNLSDFTTVVMQIVNRYNQALGYANLFGIPEHFDDLATCIRVFRVFSDRLKHLYLDEKANELYHQVREDPELIDLSMLCNIDVFESFFYFNSTLWLKFFYKELLVEIASEELTCESFKVFCMNAIDSHFMLKASNFIEHSLYMLQKLKILIECDPEDFKVNALAMQHHIVEAWSKLNLHDAMLLEERFKKEAKKG